MFGLISNFELMHNKVKQLETENWLKSSSSGSTTINVVFTYIYVIICIYI